MNKQTIQLEANPLEGGRPGEVLEVEVTYLKPSFSGSIRRRGYYLQVHPVTVEVSTHPRHPSDGPGPDVVINTRHYRLGMGASSFIEEASRFSSVRLAKLAALVPPEKITSLKGVVTAQVREFTARRAAEVQR